MSSTQETFAFSKISHMQWNSVYCACTRRNTSNINNSIFDWKSPGVSGRILSMVDCVMIFLENNSGAISSVLTPLASWSKWCCRALQAACPAIFFHFWSLKVFLLRSQACALGDEPVASMEKDTLEPGQIPSSSLGCLVIAGGSSSTDNYEVL